MDNELPCVKVEKPEWEIIGGGIEAFNQEKAGEDNAKSLCFVVYAPDQEIVGGVIGATYWDWLHVDLMWVKEEFRGRGYGQRLLELAEDEARQRGAKQVYLDTFSFQAPDFYKKHGYQVFGILQDFPSGFQRYFLTKLL
jgi:GNAT superfamily N-acetyltransferase